jgi:hypothetical protein
MKILISLIAMVALFAATGAQAAGYSGTGQTRGFVSKTGMVKERTDEEDHMTGKENASEPEDGDVPATTDVDEKDDGKK